MVETLHVTIRGFLVHDGTSGFAVLTAFLEDSGEIVKIVADVAPVEIGDRVEVTGQWERHPRFGRQFRVATVLPYRPRSAGEILSYLEVGHVRGIRGRLAKRLFERFGDDLLRVLDDEPQRVLEVPGIGAQKLDTISRSWEQQHGVRNVFLFLSAHGITAQPAFRIHKQYGDRSIDVIRKDPYRLAYEVRGIGFDFADKLAQRLGHDVRSPFRLMAGLRHVVNQARGKGHCGIAVDDALKEMVSCDVPGRCSLKRVAHPGDFRQSESSSNKQVDRKDPDERAQECAKFSRESSTAGQTSVRTRMVGARGVGGRRYQ